jgi:hypothetical protein
LKLKAGVLDFLGTYLNLCGIPVLSLSIGRLLETILSSASLLLPVSPGSLRFSNSGSSNIAPRESSLGSVKMSDNSASNIGKNRQEDASLSGEL